MSVLPPPFLALLAAADYEAAAAAPQTSQAAATPLTWSRDELLKVISGINAFVAATGLDIANFFSLLRAGPYIDQYLAQASTLVQKLHSLSDLNLRGLLDLISR